MSLAYRWIHALVAGLAICLCHAQSLVITARDDIRFVAGIDSVFYTLRWGSCLAIHLRTGMKNFFVLTSDDSAFFQKKIPSLNEIHHFVLERKENSKQVALFYRGLLPAIPDTATLLKEKTAIALSMAHLPKPVAAVKETQPPTTDPPESNSTPPDTSLATESNKLHNASTDSARPGNASPSDTTLVQPAEEIPAVSAFAAVVSAAKQAEFEFEKIMLMREYFTRHKTNTEELKIFAGLLTYDLTRLQLLKEAFAYTLDKNNYSSLVFVFDFDLTRQTFKNFLSENEHK